MTPPFTPRLAGCLALLVLCGCDSGAGSPGADAVKDALSRHSRQMAEKLAGVDNLVCTNDPRHEDPELSRVVTRLRAQPEYSADEFRACAYNFRLRDGVVLSEFEQRYASERQVSAFRRVDGVWDFYQY